MKSVFWTITVLALILGSSCGSELRRREAKGPAKDLESVDTYVEEVSDAPVVALSSDLTPQPEPAPETQAEVALPARVPEERIIPTAPPAVPADDSGALPVGTIITDKGEIILPGSTPRPTEEETAVSETITPTIPAAAAPESDPPHASEVEIAAVPEEETLPATDDDPTTAAAYESRFVSGYRVQLMATVEPNQAKQFAESVRPLFDDNVYVEYLEPYYKVRIGDCKTREEASLLMRSARNAGFDQAWVTQTQIIERIEPLR